MTAENPSTANPELTALEKHGCAACGAQAEWNPAKQALICGYCGTVAPVELDQDTGSVREIPLVQTLREMPENLRGWKADKRSVRCRSCHAVSVLDPERVGQNCDFCGSAQLVDYDEIKAPIRPQSVLPFQLDRVRVKQTIKRWLSSKWFAPSKLKRDALVDTVHGVYVPYWTFDAAVRCPWTATAGKYYYTTESYRDSKGRTRTRRVRHTRWFPAAGEIEHFFDDQPIPGTRGVDTKLLERVEPFPTGDLVPYDTAYLSGFVVEHYQVVLIEAAELARKAMDDRLRALCGAQVPGDTYRNLQISPAYSGQTFKHILVPVWLLSYRFGSKNYQLVINGYTGKVSGRYPKSFWKIFFLVAAIALLVLGIVLVA